MTERQEYKRAALQALLSDGSRAHRLRTLLISRKRSEEELQRCAVDVAKAVEADVRLACMYADAACGEDTLHKLYAHGPDVSTYGEQGGRGELRERHGVDRTSDRGNGSSVR